MEKNLCDIPVKHTFLSGARVLSRIYIIKREKLV